MCSVHIFPIRVVIGNILNRFYRLVRIIPLEKLTITKLKHGDNIKPLFDMKIIQINDIA